MRKKFKCRPTRTRKSIKCFFIIGINLNFPPSSLLLVFGMQKFSPVSLQLWRERVRERDRWRFAVRLRIIGDIFGCLEEVGESKRGEERSWKSDTITQPMSMLAQTKSDPSIFHSSSLSWASSPFFFHLTVRFCTCGSAVSLLLMTRHYFNFNFSLSLDCWQINKLILCFKDFVLISKVNHHIKARPLCALSLALFHSFQNFLNKFPCFFFSFSSSELLVVSTSWVRASGGRRSDEVSHSPRDEENSEIKFLNFPCYIFIAYFFFAVFTFHPPLAPLIPLTLAWRNLNITE